jgi:hypothetical protein
MDQVVCIRDDWIAEGRALPAACPVKGRIYTIVKTERGRRWMYYFLAELSGTDCWNEEAFRPVKKTDIGIFTKMLKSTKKTKKREKETA